MKKMIKIITNNTDSYYSFVRFYASFGFYAENQQHSERK